MGYSLLTPALKECSPDLLIFQQKMEIETLCEISQFWKYHIDCQFALTTYSGFSYCLRGQYTSVQEVRHKYQ